MANVLSREKANAIAAAYMTNGYRKVDALLSVGYKTTYANSNVGLKLFDNVRVKEAIARIEAANNAKTDFTVEFVRKEMMELLEDCKKENDRTNRKGAVELMARHKSMLSDNLNTTDVIKQAELAKMSEEERIELKRIASIRLQEMTQTKAG
jgi:hypothetical protein